MKKLLAIALLLLTFSCAKENVPAGVKAGDYLVFGDYYGECFGEHCVSMYLLNGNSLFQDSNKNTPSTISLTKEIIHSIAAAKSMR